MLISYLFDVGHFYGVYLQCMYYWTGRNIKTIIKCRFMAMWKEQVDFILKSHIRYSVCSLYGDNHCLDYGDLRES